RRYECWGLFQVGGTVMNQINEARTRIHRMKNYIFRNQLIFILTIGISVWNSFSLQAGETDNIPEAQEKGYEAERHGDYAKAIKWYKKDSLNGDPAGSTSIGSFYAKGLGVPQDFKEAMKWFLKGAKQGGTFSERNIGLCYANGSGVTQDYKEAMKWYKDAAEKYEDIASYHIGQMYQLGHGVPIDFKKAMEFYLKAE